MTSLGHITLKPECPVCGAQAVKTLPNNVNFKKGKHSFVLRTKMCDECKVSWHTLEAPVVMNDSINQFKVHARRFRQSRK